jgi:uncharacterized protein YcfJ
MQHIVHARQWIDPVASRNVLTMNKWMLIGVIAGAGIATAGAVVAYSMRDSVTQEITAQTDQEMPADASGMVAEAQVAADAQVAAEAAPTPVKPAGAAAAVPAAPVPAPTKVTANTSGSAKTSKPAKTSGSAKTTQVAAAAPAAPAEECWDEEVTHTADPKDDHRIAGTVIGGVVGAAIGNQFGGGSGKTLATVAGAAGGAYAGNRAQKAVQEKNTYTTIERRCKPAQ